MSQAPFDNDPWSARTFVSTDTPVAEPNVDDPWRARTLPQAELGFMAGLADVKGRTLLPFAGAALEAKHLANLHSAVKRVEEGTQSEEDEQMLVEFLQLQDRASRGGVGYKVATILAELPAFVVEFMAGGAAIGKVGAKVAAGKAIKEAVERGARKSAQFAVRNWAVSKGVARTGAGIAKTSLTAGAQLGAMTAIGEATGLGLAPFQGYAGGSRISGNAWRRALPDMALSGDESTGMTLHFYNTADDFLEHLPTAVADEYIEILSERSGAGLRSAFSKLPVADQVAAMQASVARWYTQKYGQGKVGQLLKKISKAGGWDGVLEEFGEERLGGFLRGATGIEEGGVLANTFPDLEQMAAELIAFSVPGVAAAGIRAGTDRRETEPLGTGFEGVMPSEAERARVSQQGPINEQEYNAVYEDLLQRGVDVVEPQTPEQLQAVEMGRRLGIDVLLISKLDGQQVPFEGVSVREGVVLIDAQEQELTRIVTHEWLHDLEKKHKPLHDALVERIQQLDPEGFVKFLNDYRQAYKEQFGKDLDPSKEATEGGAAYADAHHALMWYATTEEGQRNLSALLQNNRTLLQEMVDWLRETVNRLTGWELRTTMQRRLDTMAQLMGREEVTISEASIAYSVGQVMRSLYGGFLPPSQRKDPSTMLPEGGRTPQLPWRPPIDDTQPRLPKPVAEAEEEPEPEVEEDPEAEAEPEAEPQPEPEAEPEAPKPTPRRQPEPEPEKPTEPEPVPEESEQLKQGRKRQGLARQITQTVERHSRADYSDDEAEREAEQLVAEIQAIKDEIQAPNYAGDFEATQKRGREAITRLRELFAGAGGVATEPVAEPEPVAEEEAPEPEPDAEVEAEPEPVAEEEAPEPGDSIPSELVARFEIGELITDEMPRVGGIREPDVEVYPVIAVNDDNLALVRVEWVPNPQQREPRTQVRYQVYRRESKYWQPGDPSTHYYQELRHGRPYRPDLLPQKWQKLLTPEAWKQWEIDAGEAPERADELGQRLNELNERRQRVNAAIYAHQKLIGELEDADERGLSIDRLQTGLYIAQVQLGHSGRAGNLSYEIVNYEQGVKRLSPDEQKPEGRQTRWLLFQVSRTVARIETDPEGAKRKLTYVRVNDDFVGYFESKKAAEGHLQSPDGPVPDYVDEQLLQLRASQKSLENRIAKIDRQHAQTVEELEAAWEELRQERQPDAEPEVSEPELPPIVEPAGPEAQLGWDTTSDRAQRWSGWYAEEYHWQGAKSHIQLPNGKKLPVTYMLVDVTDLLPTHDEETFQPNPGADINERQYQDEQLASESREMVRRIAENPDPDQLYSNSVTAVEGPPIVTPHGIVLGGNARTMGLMRAYRLDAEGADVLYTAAIQRAEDFGVYEQEGVDKTAVQSTEYQMPVIVRVIDESHMGNPGELSRVLNEQHTVQRTLGTEAVGRAQRIDSETIQQLSKLFASKEGEETVTFAGIVNNPAKTVELLSILSRAGAWTENDTAKHYAQQQKLDQGGKELLQRTLVAAAVHNVQNAAGIFKLPAAQLNKLMAGLPGMMRSRSYEERAGIIFGHMIDGLVELKSYPGTLTDLIHQAQVSGREDWVDNKYAVSLIEAFMDTNQREWAGRMSQLGIDLQAIADGQTQMFNDAPAMTLEQALLAAGRLKTDDNPNGQAGMFSQDQRDKRESQAREEEDYTPRRPPGPVSKKDIIRRSKKGKGDEPAYSLRRTSDYNETSAQYREYLEGQGVSPANTADIVRQLRDLHVEQAGDDFDAQDQAYDDIDNTDSQYRQFERQFLLDIADGRIGWGVGWNDHGQEGSTDQEEADLQNDHQVAYTPVSTSGPLNTVAPKNMLAAMKRALKKFVNEHGSPDDYVARELGWTAQQTKERLGAEQVDTTALAIEQIKNGKAFVLGAQTGVGKGRVTRAIELWAVRNGKPVIMVTEGHGLFEAGWRDISSIGAEGDIKPYALSWQASPVRVSAKYTWIPNQAHGPDSLNDNKRKAARRAMVKYVQEHGALPNGYTSLWATYTDFNQKGKRDNPMKHPMLRALAPHAVWVLDESHKMIGQESKSGDRGELMQDLVAQGQGAMFSSATFAKTPYAFRMFRQTDLALAGSIDNTIKSINDGGRAMEQYATLMLANAGQLVRYERSYTGIQFHDVVVPAVKEDGTSRMDAVALLMRRVRTLDAEGLGAAKAAMLPSIRQEMEPPKSHEGEKDRYNYSVQKYADIVHTVARAALMSAKAEDVVNVAAKEVRRGRKPVIFADMTGESGVQRWLEKSEDYEIGSEVDASNITFAEYMDYAIDRLRTITVSDPALQTNKKTIATFRMTDADLEAYGMGWVVAEIESIMEEARETLQGLPGSPYDYVVNRLRQEGIQAAELSGRSVEMTYESDPREPGAKAKLERRNQTAAMRNAARDSFNSGTTDVLLYNSSAATGVDMHAGENFADQRQRVFLGWQAAEDITTQVQAFGRINRTGQVKQPNARARRFDLEQYGSPEYYMLYADVPVEQKTRAIVAAKMQQLGALTAASSRSATNLEAVDPIMNKYGDQAAQTALDQLDPGIAEALQMTGSVKTGFASRMANRALALTVAEQRELFDSLDNNYAAIVAQLNAEGRNDIEALAMDVDAQTVSAVIHEHARGPSPFQQPVVEERIDMRLEDLPLTNDQMKARTNPQLDERIDEIQNTVVKARESWQAKMRERQDELERRTAELDRQRAELPGRVSAGEIEPQAAEAMQTTLLAEIRSMNQQAAGARTSIQQRQNASDVILEVLSTVKTLRRYARSGDRGVRYTASYAGGGRKDFYGRITDIIAPNTEDPAKLLQAGRYYLKFYGHESGIPMQLPFNSLGLGMRIDDRFNLEFPDKIDEYSQLTRETGRIQKSFLSGDLLKIYDKHKDKGRLVLLKDEVGRFRSGLLMHGISDLNEQTNDYDLKVPATAVETLIDAAARVGENAHMLAPHDRSFVPKEGAAQMGHLRFLINFSESVKQPQYMTLEMAMRPDSPERNLFGVQVTGTASDVVKAMAAMGGRKRRLRKWWTDPHNWPSKTKTIIGYHARLSREQINELLDLIPTAKEARVWALSVIGKKDQQIDDALDRGARVSYQRRAADIPVESLAKAMGRKVPGPTPVTDLNWLDENLYSLRRRKKGKAKPSDLRRALSFDVGTERFLDRWRRRLQDRDLRWKRLEEAMHDMDTKLDDSESVYLSMELYPGRTEARVSDWDKKHYDALLKWMSEHNISLDDADLYLYARHAGERNEYIARKRIAEWVKLETQRVRTNAQNAAARKQKQLDKERQSRSPKSMRRSAQLYKEIEELLRVAADPSAHIGDPPADLPFTQPNDPGSGMRTEDANRLIKQYHAENADGYIGLSRLVNRMNTETRERQVAAGLISERQAEEWQDRYQNYVPLRTNVEPGRETVGPRFDTGQTESREAWGRKTLAFSPLTYSIQQGRKSVIRAEKNRIGQTLLRLIDKHGDMLSSTMQVREEPQPSESEDGELMLPQIAQPRFNEFSTKKGGRIYYIEVQDPLLLKSLNGMSMKHPHNIVRYLSMVIRFLSAVNTSWNPEFLLTNFLRDVQTAGLNLTATQSAAMARSTVSPVSLKNAAKAIWAANKGQADATNPWHRAYQEMRDAGGLAGWFYMKDVTQEKAALSPKYGAKGRAVADTWNTIRQHVENAQKIVENGVRLSAYYHARQKGVSVDRAASLSKNLTVNFNRQGEWGQVLNAVYMFYNAGVQSTRTIMAALRTRKGKGVAVFLIAMSMMLDEINSAIGDDDEYGMPYYDKIPEYELERNMVFMIPGGGDAYMKIPLPYGFNIFHAIGTAWNRLRRDVISTSDAVGSIASSTYGAFFPFGSDATVLQAMSPTLLDPVVQVYENKTFYGAPMRPHSYGAVERPDHQQYWSSVSETSRVFTSGLNKLFGLGSEVRPNVIPFLDISPETIDHMAGFIGGGFARFLGRVGGIDRALSEGNTRDIPFVRTLLSRADDRFDAAKYYALRTDITQAKDEYELARAQRDREAMQTVAKQNAYLLNLVAPLRSTESRLRKLRKIKKNTVDEERKKQINQAMRDTQRRLLGYLYQRGQLIPQ